MGCVWRSDSFWISIDHILWKKYSQHNIFLTKIKIQFVRLDYKPQKLLKVKNELCSRLPNVNDSSHIRRKNHSSVKKKPSLGNKDTQGDTSRSCVSDI